MSTDRQQASHGVPRVGESRSRGLPWLAALLISTAACAKEDGAASPVSTVERTAAEKSKLDRSLEGEREPDPFPGVVDELQRDGAQADPAPPEETTPALDAPTVPGSSRGGAAGLEDLPKDAKTRREKKSRDKKAPRKKGKKPSSEPQGGRGSGPAPQTPKTDSTSAIADPEHMIANLTSLEGQLRSAGVRLPQDAGGEDKEFDESQLDCEKVCRLRVAICSLEERICSMAAAHPEDDRYANACERAQGDCRVAKRACESCD